MSPDDPRHGTPAGRAAHRRAGVPVCDPCRAANALYQRRYRKVRSLYGDRLAPSLGTGRRVRALMALGWSIPQIASRTGMAPNQLWMTTQQPHVTHSTAARVAAVYEEMCMALPPTDTLSRRISVAKVRAHALRNGYAPPLAYDDIDRDPAPVGLTPGDEQDIDRAVVERILAGDNRVAANVAERREVVRRWVEGGRPVNELARLTGWKVERYGRARVAA